MTWYFLLWQTLVCAIIKLHSSIQVPNLPNELRWKRRGKQFHAGIVVRTEISVSLTLTLLLGMNMGRNALKMWLSPSSN
jgi:hypothetical protein